MFRTCYLGSPRRAARPIAFFLLLLFASVKWVGAQTGHLLTPRIPISPYQAQGAGQIDAETSSAQRIFQLTNQDRAAQGLSAFSWSPALAAAALAHARLMAASNVLSHRYPGEADLAMRTSQAGSHFSSVAENIAQGTSPRQIDQAWMHSPPHRMNILDRRMNALGIAVIASQGTLYAVQDFAASVPLLSPAAVAAKVEEELRNLPPDEDGSAIGPGESLVIRSREEADRNCSLPSGLLPGSQARFVVRWQSPTVDLPQPLVDALRSGKYPAAAVGTCLPSANAESGFVVYRVTVLLY